MANAEIVHVAIAPTGVTKPDLVTQVAAIINKDLYSTHLLLAGKSPRIIAHYQNFTTAEVVAQRLRKLGLITLTIKDSELSMTSSPIFEAYTLQFGQGEIIFQDHTDKTRAINPENVFLILEGIWQTSTEKEIIKNKRKLNLLGTLLTGGIPISRKVQEKTIETTFQAEYFVRLYHRNSPEPDVEINQYDFDYSCLGSSMSGATLTNFNILAEKIQGLCPRAIFDDRLAESAVTQQNNIDIQCKLTYLLRESAINCDVS
jgi:hypothetical protein